MIRGTALLLLAALAAFAQGGSYDVLITHAKVVDGSGGPWFYGDIGIRGDTIAAVGVLANRGRGVRKHEIGRASCRERV